MSRAVHLVRDDDVLLAGVVEDGTLTDLMAERAGEAVRPGDIFLARVDRRLRDPGAAYVDLGLERPAFLPDAGEAAATTVLVQVVRAAREDKAIEVTRDIALPSTRLVYRPFGAGIAVSRRIDADTARTWRPDPPGGWILRAAAAGAAQSDLDEEAGRLSETWRAIAAAADPDGAPRRLHRGPDAAARLILDLPPIDEVRVDDAGWRRSLVTWLEAIDPVLSGNVRGDPMDLREEVPPLCRPEVPLPTGGSIVVEATRALTAIDVNAGAASDIVQVNRQAARTIARELRLRNIGGIVVVDFISMKRRDARKAVVDLFRSLLEDDPARVRTARGLSGLGLFELARERRGQALADVIGGQPSHAIDLLNDGEP